MSPFLNYLTPELCLESRIRIRFMELALDDRVRGNLLAFLEPLRVKDLATYEHCLRVSLLASALGKFMHLDAKALLYAGLLHDVGKLQTRLSTLQKTEGWLPADTEEVKSHVIDGYRILRDCFDFTAEIILWHHRFQPGRYPECLPPPLHDYSEGTRVMIPLFGRLLSLADVFDALHRVNDKHGPEPLSGKDIKTKMLSFNPDQRVLIEEAYEAGIFTTEIA